MTERAAWRHVALCAAIVGAGISAYLLVEYASGQGGICVTGSGCDEVRNSAYAYPFGTSMPILSMPFFGLVFYLAAAYLAWRTFDPAPLLGVSPRIVLGLWALAGVGVSAVLTGLEAFVIHAFCTWCLAQAAASLTLGVAAAIGLRSRTDGSMAEPGSKAARRRAESARQSELRSLQRNGLLTAAGMALLVTGLLAGGALGSGTPTPSGSQGTDNLAPSSAPRTGTGAVTVVEFADYQCPACAVVAPELQTLVDDGLITLVYRNFPLPQHAHAQLMARSAVAAGLQGKFWQLHDRIFATQSDWENLATDQAQAYVTTLAQQVGLDVTKWQADVNASNVANIVTADFDKAEALQLSGTPTLFIDGRLYNGSLSLDALRSAVTSG